MSQRPGNTLMPSVEMISAPGGIASDPTWPTALIRSPSMITTLLRIGLLPKPSISVPPTRAFNVADRVCDETEVVKSDPLTIRRATNRICHNLTVDLIWVPSRFQQAHLVCR